jgi:lipid II:glycine glycyltransferase (peptidoglycan interpeptide bridge formation enzyme)
VNNNYKTIIETGDGDAHWDAFLSGLENSHYEQSICWARVKQHQGWEAIRIKVLKGSNWLAGAQMLCKRLPFGGSIGYVPSGPFYTVPNDQSLDVLMRSINKLAKERSIQYVAITPSVVNEYLDKILEKHGYSPTQELLPPFTIARATLIFDLSKPLDTLLMDMRRETRRQIKLALKSGFTVCEGDKKDLDTLFRLMSIVANRRGDKPVPDRIDVFNNIWDYFYPKGYVKLLTVKLRGEPVSMGIIFTFGNTVRFWKVGWSGAEIKKHPTQLLYWELIKWSKNNGFRYFDNVQVDSFVTDHLSLGLPVTDELKSRRLYGTTVFKISFGGQVLKLSGPWFRFQNPVIRLLYRYFGPAIMKMPFTKKIISGVS